MSTDRERFARRDFLKASLALGTGAAGLGVWPGPVGAEPRSHAGIPLIITSHDNETGQRALGTGWDILSSGGSALDAIERAANVIELDPDDASVGLGGLPNAEGVIQLDASIMDGKTYNAGSVASLENVATPSSVARAVMERTDHVMLVGPGALDFARSFGFEEQNLLTERAREAWVRWRERLSSDDVWGPAAHLRGRRMPGDAGPIEGPDDMHYGTTNVLAVDANGDLAGLTTTSGWSWKIPGRIGDSPIIGAGLYVDNSVGAAGATGRGEDVIKSCASFFIVMRMRDGRSPQQACEDTLEMIVDRYRAIGIDDFVPGEKFVAINKAGDYGCAWMGVSNETPGMSVRTPEGLRIVRGSTRYAPTG